MSLDDELREALGGPEGTAFDYDALVAGTKARASRLRRRRAARHAVTAVVLAPVLVGTGWLVGTNLSGQAPDQVHVASTTEADSTADGLPGTDASTTDAAEATTAVPDGGGAPFQDPDALPDSTPGAENPDLPNAWDVPDVRPTGVPFLDAMGAPDLDLRYPRIMPLPTFMAGNDQGLADGVGPLAGAEWSFSDDGGGMLADAVDISVTGWEDSAAVLASLPTGTPVTHAQWLEPWTALPWAGAAPEDLLLVAETAPDTGHLVGAMVRQGDYLVGVSVRARTQEEAVAVATEVAERTAANLAHLDPERARE